MRALLTVLLALLVTYISAQSDFRFRNYTINDGLSQSSVTCITQDELSSIWIGTQDGLNRFDGKRFEQYFSDNTPGLDHSHIRCAKLDNKGNIWFGTNNGLTIYYIESEEFKTFRPSPNQAFQVEDIAIDPEGNLWLTTPELGLFSFDPKQTNFSKHEEVSARNLGKLKVIRGGRLLITTEDNGLIIFDPKKNSKQIVSLSDELGKNFVANSFFDYSESEQGLATTTGVFSLNVTTLELTRRFTALDEKYGLQNVSDVYFHSEVGWFIATNGNGLFTLYDEGEITHNVSDIFQKNALLFNELVEIFRDASGSVWVTSRRGVSTFNPLNRGFLGVGPSGNRKTGLSNPSVWSFTETDDERYLYVGTDDAVTRYDRYTEVFDHFVRTGQEENKGKGEQAILSIQVVSNNKLLLGCADGLYELIITGPSNYQFKEIDLGRFNKRFNHTRVYKVLAYDKNRSILATKEGAALYDHKNNKAVLFEHNPKKASNTISKGICRLAYRDHEGRYWLSTSTGGLNILSDRNGTIEIRPYEYNFKIKEVTTNYITSIYDDGSGVYWFGTSGSGLINWNEHTKEAKKCDKSSGLPNDVVYGVLKDKRGLLWLSTNRGICSFNISSEKVKAYSEVDGLLSNEFNLGAYHMSPTGEMFFGNINGYNHFKPRDIKTSRANIHVVFTKFKLDNDWLKPNQEGSPLTEPIFRTRTIELNYNERSFTIRFQASDLSNPERLNFKYILKGSEEEEIFIGSLNEIHFNSLAHGDYELSVYARLGEGPWSEYPARINVLISPPFWLTWWFWAIIALFLAISIRLFIKSRIEASRREQVRLEVKVKARTKEIALKNKEIEQKNREIEAEKNKVLQQQKLLQREKDKTERVLKNVIPESTAEELKKRGRARARAYKTVSVLFTDFVGFTKISDGMKPSELVKKLDVYFTKFDEIIVKNSLEKIKTIGDSYMCAGGVPVRNKTNPIDACLAALQIQHYMERRKNDAIANGSEYWELRLGINTGEVTAGVIGSERLAYDIWGATVNQASRMEMLGSPGEVTVSGATYTHIEPYFDVVFKGKAQTKSRGVIDMYVVKGIKPELSKSGEGIYPNSKFHEIVNLHHYSSINYYKAERHIMKLLEQKLSKQLHYHSIAHTKDVVKAVERIALLEGVTDEGLFLLKSAATYHDAGFVEQYDKNEPIGARLAQEILPKYGYTQEHIDRIKELIYVTMIPHQPKNRLEEIICDADLDYLGRDDFHEIADKLRLELREHGKINSDRQWDEIQVKFLTSHKYFTKTAKRTRLQKKKENLQEVIERLERNEYKD